MRCVLGFKPEATVQLSETSWDWKFGGINSQKQWILVTLKVGSTFAGYYGKHSFTSSDPTNRDIYIQNEAGIRKDRW